MISDFNSIYDTCISGPVNFLNNSYSVGSAVSTWFWNFGDTTYSYEENPTINYSSPGEFEVTLRIMDEFGCLDSIQKIINWTPAPETIIIAPDFSVGCQPFSVFFNNLTTPIDSTYDIIWNFNAIDSRIERDPTYVFRDTGIQKIQLIVSDIYGCSDTLIKSIDVIPEITYYLPNAFTPNGDGINDTYRGTGILNGVEKFTLEIFNRWGEGIFETNNPNESWDGINNNGKQMGSGVYLCRVIINAPRGEIRMYKNYVTLIR